MKTTPFLEHICYDMFEERDNITFRPMMGGFTLYKDGKVFAIINDEKFYFKGDKDTEEWYLKNGAKKFWYIRKGKKQYMNYFLVPEDILEDRNFFQEWVDVALTVANKVTSKPASLDVSARTLVKRKNN